MLVAYAVDAIVLSLALVGSGIAKLTKQPRVVASIGNLGVPLSWFPALALAETAGAIGLILGMWMASLGIAAGIGVVLYFVGAVGAHLRAHNRELAPPVALGLLAAAAITLRILST